MDGNDPDDGRVLDLVPDSDPLAWHVNSSVLWSTMAAPNDPPLRAAIRARMVVKLLAREQEINPDVRIRLPVDSIKAIADDDLMKRLYGGADIDASRHAKVAGLVLYHLFTLARAFNREAGLEKAIFFTSQYAKSVGRWQNGDKMPANVEYIRTMWRDYKSVANLWFGQLAIGDSGTIGSDEQYQRRVVELLRYAEAIRGWVERFVPCRATRPLVMTGEMYRCPSQYHVAELDLGDHEIPLSTQATAWLRTYKARKKN